MVFRGFSMLRRIKLSDTQDLLSYLLPSSFLGNWEEFRKLIDKIDKVYEEIA